MVVQAASGPCGEFLWWWFGEEALNEAISKVEHMVGQDAKTDTVAGAMCGPGTRWDAETELCVLASSE